MLFSIKAGLPKGKSMKADFGFPKLKDEPTHRLPLVCPAA
jgi:hypothetical protein